MSVREIELASARAPVLVLVPEPASALAHVVVLVPVCAPASAPASVPASARELGPVPAPARATHDGVQKKIGEVVAEAAGLAPFEAVAYPVLNSAISHANVPFQAYSPRNVFFLEPNREKIMIFPAKRVKMMIFPDHSPATKF